MKRWLMGGRLARINRRVSSTAGYTITEVIIVLAVTTSMFVAIVLSFNGRQARVEFTQAVRNYEATLQNVIDEVANGVYESSSPCSVVGASPPVFVAGPTQSGARTDCIFVGKLILPVRGVPNTISTSDTIVSIVGRRLTSTTPAQPVSTIAQAQIRADTSVNRDEPRSFQLRVTRIVRLSNLTTNVATIGFFNRLNGAGGTSQLVQLYGRSGTSVPVNLALEVTPARLNSLIPLPEGVLICLLGQNNQRAEVRLGGNNASTTTITSTLDTAAGVCP